MACTAFKRPTKKLGMHGLFILGLGFDPIQNISSVKPLLVLCALIGWKFSSSQSEWSKAVEISLKDSISCYDVKKIMWYS